MRGLRGGGRFGARAALAAAALLLVAVPFALLLLLVRSEWSPLRGVDLDTAALFNRLLVDRPAVVDAVQLLTDLGSPTTWRLVTLAAVVALLLRGRRRLGLFLVVTSAGSSALVNGIKLAVDRARPVLDDPVSAAPGASFPSGHATEAMVHALALLLVLTPAVPREARRWVAAAVVGLAIAVGASRVVLGVHYASDVVAGFVLAIAWVAATTAAFSAWRHDLGRPGVDPTEGLEPEFPAGRSG